MEDSRPRNLTLGVNLCKQGLFLDKDINFLSPYFDDDKILTLQDKINIISSGETMTAKILFNYLSSKNIRCCYYDSAEFINCNLSNSDIFNKGEFTLKYFA